MSESTPRLHYVDTRQGQLHVRSWVGPKSAAPVAVCLHPVPYSGRYFHRFAACLREEMHVLALDLPGYGGSAPTVDPISIAQHADAIADALEAMRAELDAPAGFMPIGFHTGSGVGGELALARPDLVTKLVFVTYPYLGPEQRAQELERWANPPGLGETLDSLQPKWDFTITNRTARVTLDDAFDYFSEQLRAADRHWHGFHAMFSYPAEDRLPNIEQPTLVINPPDALNAMTGAAVELLNNAEVVDIDFGKKAIFDLHPQQLTDLIAPFAKRTRR